MAARNYSSTADDTTLSASVTDSATTLTVSGTTGFPAAPFTLALDAGAATQELVLVTNMAGTTLTVTRGYDSTVAQAHSGGAVVRHVHAAIDFREAGQTKEAYDAHAAATAAHGASGAVVGTTNTQTLTNKTLTTPTLTTPTMTAPVATGSLASFGGAWSTYTPTFTGVTATVGHARYSQIGKLITVHFGFTTTGAATDIISMTLPLAAHATYNAVQAVGGATGDGLAPATVTTKAGLTAVEFLRGTDGAAWGTTVPVGSGVLIRGTLTYEAV